MFPVWAVLSFVGYSIFFMFQCYLSAHWWPRPAPVLLDSLCGAWSLQGVKQQLGIEELSTWVVSTAVGGCCRIKAAASLL